MAISRPKLISLVQQVGLKRSGLVVDCLFPQVQTPCFFEYIDWTGSRSLAAIDDAASCNSDIKIVSPDSFNYVQKKVEDHALQVAMTDCCVTSCSQSDAEVASQLAKAKTISTSNRLLINREQLAIKLATDVTKYVDNTTKKPGDAGAVNEGGLYNLSLTTVQDANAKLLNWFLPIQEGNGFSGPRNVAIMDRYSLNLLKTHPSFIGYGCVAPGITTDDVVAANLGVSKICVADAPFDNGLGSTVNFTTPWPKGTILFVSSYELLSSSEQQVSFGISAYNKGWRTTSYMADEKGQDAGVEMQKIAHDLTPVVLSYKAATMVKIA